MDSTHWLWQVLTNESEVALKEDKRFVASRDEFVDEFEYAGERICNNADSSEEFCTTEDTSGISVSNIFTKKAATSSSSSEEGFSSRSETMSEVLVVLDATKTEPDGAGKAPRTPVVGPGLTTDDNARPATSGTERRAG